MIRLSIHVEHGEGKDNPVGEAELTGSEQEVGKLNIVEDGSSVCLNFLSEIKSHLLIGKRGLGAGHERFEEM